MVGPAVEPGKWRSNGQIPKRASKDGHHGKNGKANSSRWQTGRAEAVVGPENVAEPRRRRHKCSSGVNGEAREQRRMKRPEIGKQKKVPSAEGGGRVSCTTSRNLRHEAVNCR